MRKIFCKKFNVVSAMILEESVAKAARDLQKDKG
jgi:hypothetical protein